MVFLLYEFRIGMNWSVVYNLCVRPLLSPRRCRRQKVNQCCGTIDWRKYYVFEGSPRIPTESIGVRIYLVNTRNVPLWVCVWKWKEDEITFNIACRMVVAIFGCGAGLSLSF